MSAIEVMLQQPVAQALGWALVQFIWQGALIGVATAVLLAALRRSAADIRYVVSTIALALMLTLPVVTAIQSLQAARGSVVPPSPGVRPADTFRTDASVSESYPHRLSMPEPSAAVPATVQKESLQRWLPVFLSLWLTGVGMLTLRLLSGWIWVHRLTSHGARPSGDAVDALAKRLTRHLHITRTIRFLESSLVDVPTVVGWLKPVVLLPASALAGLTPQQLEALLAHELAHIRRHDYLVNLLQTVVETLLFYHPAVWWLSRRIRIERENCCDDLAVSLCGDPVTYAAALAEMEGMRGHRGQLVLAATGGSLLQRVRRVLGAPSHAGRAPGWLAAGVAILVIVGICASAVGGDASEAVLVGTITDALGDDDQRFGPPDPPEPPERPERPEPPEPAAPPELPEPPEPAEPPEPSEPFELATLADLAIAEARALAVIRRETARPISREQATRRCIDWVRNELPTQLQGHAHALRGACQALASVRQLMKEEGRHLAELARNAAAAAPIAVEAAAEPLAQAAAAIAEASQAGTAHLEPMLAELSRAIEEAQSEVSRATAAHLEPVLAEAARAVEKAQRAAGQSSTRSSRSGQKSGNYTWSNNGEGFEVNFRGDVEFTDDDADVRSLTPGGWLRIKERRRVGPDHTIEFESESDGTIRRRFWVNGSERPYEPEGRKWAAEVLPRFIRQSGMGAAGRVARIHRSKGSAGVFAEIALVEGGWAKRVYYTELLKLPSITAGDVQRALTQAGTEIQSDFELASLLISSNHLVRDDATRKAYFGAARTIESDFEMRRVFSAALKNGPVSPALLVGVLDASASIESDFEAASLLAQIAELQPIDGTTRVAFFKALESVASAFEHRRVLMSVLKRNDVSPEVLASALASAAQVSSDFDCASVLLQFVKSHPVEGAVREPFFKALSTIDSSFERGRVLQAVARRSDASQDTVLSVIRSAHSMSGGFEKAQVLLAVAGSHELTREGRDAYIEASQRLGNFEQGRVLAALVRNERRK